MLTLMTTFAVRTAGDSRFFAAEDDIYYTHTHTSTHIVLRFRFIGKYLRHRKKSLVIDVMSDSVDSGIVCES